MESYAYLNIAEARLNAVTTVSPEVEAFHAANMGTDNTGERDGQFNGQI